MQGKDKDVRNMISAVNAVSAKLAFFIQQLKAKRFQHFPSVANVLETLAGAADALNTDTFCDLLIKLALEFLQTDSEAFRNLSPV